MVIFCRQRSWSLVESRNYCTRLYGICGYILPLSVAWFFLNTQYLTVVALHALKLLALVLQLIYVWHIESYYAILLNVFFDIPYGLENLRRFTFPHCSSNFVDVIITCVHVGYRNTFKLLQYVLSFITYVDIMLYFHILVYISSSFQIISSASFKFASGQVEVRHDLASGSEDNFTSCVCCCRSPWDRG